MPGRVRSRVRGTVSGGSYTFYSSTYHGVSGTSDYEYCSDSTQPAPFVADQTLYLYRKTVKDVLRLSGPIRYPSENSSIVGTYSGYNLQNRSLYQYVPEGPPIDWAYYKTKALANIDPGKPKVDLPLFVFELKDFPRMLRNAGQVLLSRPAKRGQTGTQHAADTYLNASFGWAPLISDLLGLLDLQKSIDDRMRYFANLEAGSTIQRSLGREILSDSTTANSVVVSHGFYNGYAADKRVIVARDVWFTANGKLKDPLPPLGDPRLRLATNTILGLTAQPERLWDFIPWTWLIDYFVNTGDYIKARGGMTRFSTTRMCIMCHTRVVDTLVNVRCKGGVSATSSTLIGEWKERAVYSNPTPTLTYKPFLTGQQIANIGALFLAGGSGRTAARRI